MFQPQDPGLQFKTRLFDPLCKPPNKDQIQHSTIMPITATFRFSMFFQHRANCTVHPLFVPHVCNATVSNPNEAYIYPHK